MSAPVLLPSSFRTTDSVPPLLTSVHLSACVYVCVRACVCAFTDTHACAFTSARQVAGAAPSRKKFAPKIPVQRAVKVESPASAPAASSEGMVLCVPRAGTHAWHVRMPPHACPWTHKIAQAACTCLHPLFFAANVEMFVCAAMVHMFVP